MEINRVWAMPNKWTFKILPISLLLKATMNEGLWVDPFAGENSPAQVTNDINPEMKTQHHLDAVDFLETFGDLSVDGVLLDPPYSLHQVTISYEGYGGKRVIALTPVYDQCARIIKVGGLCISFGWNSNGLSWKRHFAVEQVTIIPHGGHHNDTIVTIERKIQSDFGAMK